MTQRLSIGAAWPLAPLALAGLGVFARSSPPTLRESPRSERAREFAPPLFALPTGAGEFEVISERSAAALHVDDDSAKRTPLSVRGRLRLGADGAFDGGELTLSGTRGGSRTTLRLPPTPARSSPIASCRTARVVGALAASGQRTAMEATMSWMRLPGGVLHVQLASAGDDAPLRRLQDELSSRSTAPRLGMVLVLQERVR